MAAYLVVDTDLTDANRYEDYKRLAKPIVEQHGGEYLARGGEITRKETDLWDPKRLVLIRFASAEQARRFYDSPEYGRARQARDGAANGVRGSRGRGRRAFAVAARRQADCDAEASIALGATNSKERAAVTETEGGRSTALTVSVAVLQSAAGLQRSKR